MRAIFRVIACAMLIWSCTAALPQITDAGRNAGWRFPAEFEKQQAVWMGWLSKQFIKGYETDTVLLNIVKALAPRVKVRICVPDAAEQLHVEALLKKNGVSRENISFYQVPFTMLYWRDFGPIFTVDGRGGMSIADFGFNCWGYYPQSDPQSRMMERIDRTVARSFGIPDRMTRLVSEGGDREVNGKGTILLTEACEFQRNPNMSRGEIEAELSEMLGVKNFIWLKQGAVEDDACNKSSLPGPEGKGVAFRSGSANNHMDEYCRFVAPDTILLAQVTKEEAARSAVARENYRRMEENCSILKKARDQDGKPFKIVRIPMPEEIYLTAQPDDEAYVSLSSNANFTDGTRVAIGEPIQVVPAQSYCNFLISNGIVVAQKYWRPGMPESVRQKDRIALDVLKRIFPDRKVVAIDAIAVNLGGGGIHCLTQQEP